MYIFFKKRFQKKGFTLIELIVVIIIIGILASVAVPAYNNYVTQSKIKSNENLEKLIQNALDAHMTEFGDYPLFSNGERIATQIFGLDMSHDYDKFYYIMWKGFKNPSLNAFCSRYSELSGLSWDQVSAIGDPNAGVIHWMFFSNQHNYRYDPNASQHLFGTGIKALVNQDSQGNWRAYSVQIDESTAITC